MLTIGEFSKAGGVSARMLRHYDRLGLLRPIDVGQENSYRYYDESQLSTLARIETLKEYGFALREIPELLSLPADALAARVHARRIAAYHELNEMRGLLRRMEDDIITMEGSIMSLDKYRVIVMQAPEQKVFALRKTINISETDSLFRQLYAGMEARGLKRAGVSQQVYMGDHFDYDHMDVEVQCGVAGDAEGDAEGVKTLPAGTFVATTHIGPYEGVRYAYEALGEWLAQHPEYKVCGQGIERYIKNESTTKNPEEYETAVLFRVEKTS